MKRKPSWLLPFAFSLLAVVGCGRDDSEATPAGNCEIVDLGDGSSAIRCPDGTELVVRNGKDGEKGDKGDDGNQDACTLGEKDGKFTLTCGDQSIVIGDACEDGFPLSIIFDGDTTEAGWVLFAVSNCTWVRGDVSIEGGGEIPAALARIEKIDGMLGITETAIEEVSFPNLTEVDVLYVIMNEALTSVDFPSLVDVRNFAISNNPQLTTLGFPSLTNVERSLRLEENPALTTVDAFPKLETVGDWFVIVGNDGLEAVGGFTSLERVGSLAVYDNDALVSVADFPALEEITGSDGPVGSSVVYIANNPVLASFGKLGSVSTIDGDVTVVNNPELPQEVIDELLDGIDITGGLYVCGNKGGGECD